MNTYSQLGDMEWSRGVWWGESELPTLVVRGVFVFNFLVTFLYLCMQMCRHMCYGTLEGQRE